MRHQSLHQVLLAATTLRWSKRAGERDGRSSVSGRLRKDHGHFRKIYYERLLICRVHPSNLQVGCIIALKCDSVDTVYRTENLPRNTCICRNSITLGARYSPAMDGYGSLGGSDAMQQESAIMSDDIINDVKRDTEKWFHDAGSGGDGSHIYPQADAPARLEHRATNIGSTLNPLHVGPCSGTRSYTAVSSPTISIQTTVNSAYPTLTASAMRTMDTDTWISTSLTARSAGGVRSSRRRTRSSLCIRTRAIFSRLIPCQASKTVL